MHTSNHRSQWLQLMDALPDPLSEGQVAALLELTFNHASNLGALLAPLGRRSVRSDRTHESWGTQAGRVTNSNDYQEAIRERSSLYFRTGRLVNGRPAEHPTKQETQLGDRAKANTERSRQTKS